MNINLEIKGAEALMARFNPGGVPSDWEARAGMAYRQRAAVVIDAVEADIRADERRIMMFEMADLVRELETTGRYSAATIVKEMWNRACRRGAKHS